MATIDYGTGEREMRCTAWTLVVYEQEFKSADEVRGDLIADTMGKVIATSDDVLTVNDDGAFVTVVEDYTRVDWNATMRALWAMLRTAADIAQSKGQPYVPTGSYDEWTRTLLEVEPDMHAVRKEVVRELQRGLFRSGAAASGKTSDEGQEG